MVVPAVSPWRNPMTTCLLAAVLVAAPGTKPEVADDIASLTKPAADPSANRAAWDRLVARGPSALLPILRAWPSDPVAINWLRTAFDQIAKDNPQRLPIDVLLAFASDAKANGKARRAALAAVERVKPGTAAKQLAGWLDDPEFGPDAVAERIALANAATHPAEALRILRETLAASPDVEQSVNIAKKLSAAGEKPDVRKPLGVVSSWHLVGPFPVSPDDGLTKSFPPEDKIDLAATFEGKAGKLKWLPVSNDPLDGRLDLVKAGVKPADGAVAYAVATIACDKITKADLRLAMVDNATVWVNGKKVFERASDYRSILRLDRYRTAVELPAGQSTILVKLVKTEAEDTKSAIAMRWQFLLRLTDERGRGISFTQREAKK
jgi:hypothetical protein